MNKKTIRKVYIAFSFIFWVAIFFIAKHEKFRIHKDPQLQFILWVVLLLHIACENYRIITINRKKGYVKKQNIEEVKRQFKFQLDTDNIPLNLIHIKSLLEKWGIDNNLLRQDLYENSSDVELYELKEVVEINRTTLDKFISSTEDSKERLAFSLTIKAYDDLGLWSWNNKITSPNNRL